jgi:hypothetical protein
MRLSNPYEESEQPLNVDIDMGLNADQNARKLFEEKRAAETKKLVLNFSFLNICFLGKKRLPPQKRH